MLSERFACIQVVALLSLLVCLVHTPVRVSVALINTIAKSYLGRKEFTVAYNLTSSIKGHGSRN